MRTKEDEFLKQLRATFKVEAAEHLQAIAAGLLELEQTPAPEAQRKIVETVFRAAHSLKGAARAVDFTQIESLCQSLEDVFAAWKRQESAPSPTALDTLHRTLDAITAAISAPEATRGARAPAARPSFDQPDQPVRHPEVSVRPRQRKLSRRRRSRSKKPFPPKKPCVSPSPNWMRGWWKRRRCSP